MVLLRRFDPEKFHRRSIRLQNWDYSWSGLYFITLNLNCDTIRFAKMVSDRMVLTKFGQILSDVWLDIPKHYDGVELDEWIIMPDHFHAIIRIKRKEFDDNETVTKSDSVGAIHESPQQQQQQNISATVYRNKRRKMLLSKLIGRFKMVTAKRINSVLNSSGKVWQRDYYEHIIRDEESLNAIRKYIANNPEKLNKNRLNEQQQ